MNCAHQTLFDTEVFVYDFYQGCQTVCCTGCVGNDIHILCICFVVNTHYECRHNFIFGRCCQDNFLCTANFVQTSFFHCSECTCGFNDIFCTAFCPVDQGSVAFAEYTDFLTIYDDAVFADFNVACETTENGVIFQLIYHIVQFCISQVNTTKFKLIFTLHQNSENNSTNTTKTIDANFNCHWILPLSYIKNNRND